MKTSLTTFQLTTVLVVGMKQRARHHHHPILNPVRVRVVCVDYLYMLFSDIIYYVLGCLISVNAIRVFRPVGCGMISAVYETCQTGTALSFNLRRTLTSN